LISIERTRSRSAKWYLYLIIVASFFSMFISATRVWFVMFSFLLLGYLIISRKKFSSFANIVLISGLLIILLINSGIITTDFLLRSSWQRLSQVFDVALGNIRATDSSAQGRYFDELPVMLSVIKQNPLIGYGYSNVTMIYSNSNFGFLNTVIMFGMVGFSLFIYLFSKYFAMITNVIKNIDKSNPLARPIKIIGISWASILIGYFSTWDFFGLYFQKTFFISIIIAITELFVHDAKKEKYTEVSNNELLNLQTIKYKRIP
jgi:O-antigen ligase